jgi:hypothetical protein
VVAAIEALEADRELLFQFQAQAGLSKLNESLAVDLRLAGIVEAWAAGASWPQVGRCVRGGAFVLLLARGVGSSGACCRGWRRATEALPHRL